MTPYLSAAEEQRLTQAAHSGDLQARNCVIMNIYDLVRSTVAKRFFPNDCEREDAVQFVIAVLCEKFHKFDSNRNVRYITYAFYWVRQALQQFKLKRSLVRFPRFHEDHGAVDLTDNHYFQDQVCTRESPPGKHLETCDNLTDLDRFLKLLFPRERDIVLRRSRGEKLREIGLSLGLTKERVRQIELNALRRMREWHWQNDRSLP